jgi:hypothetical protein
MGNINTLFLVLPFLFFICFMHMHTLLLCKEKNHLTSSYVSDAPEFTHTRHLSMKQSFGGSCSCLRGTALSS